MTTPTDTRGAACYWFCCGQLIARADRVTDRAAAEKVAAHKGTHA